MTTRRKFLLGSAAALAAQALPGGVQAQPKWPVKPIRAIVPFSTGSTIDIIGRIVLEPLAAQLGQPIVVENRGGAGGSIGSALVAKAEPDGYTMLINASAHTAAAAVYPNLPYHPARDFAGVVLFGSVPNVTVISPAKGIRTLKELVEAARKGSFTFASAGVGSATHWAAERLRLAAGFNAVHVPFRGGPEALTEVMTGRVDFMSIGISSGLPLIRSGKLLPLAVSTRTRSSALPDVPTTIEAGFPDSDYTFWNGVLVPAKTPRAIIERLHAEIHKLMRDPAIAEKLKHQGVEPMPLTPAEFDAMIAREIEINLALVKAAGLKF
ncbi:MAG TPA: tripartite tricarboxylate transporter substrate binding protein [Burkholderiales bacterium]|nr:tripartite tricarboxylate transporter substrate binding protein [Burkholderiales bacterium]